jgi:arabinose-5-phosphate isomerase
VEAGLHGLAPTTSTAAMLAVGDALALVISQVRNFTPQQFAVFHPGGSLGRRLASVKDIMRAGDQVRIASESATIREVFVTLARPGRRTGAVMLVDADGRLSGLFTDSDLARLLEHHRDQQFDRPISEVMTNKPLTISPDAILEEVLQLLGARHVSELPVVDAAGCPVGLIDITDLIGLG